MNSPGKNKIDGYRLNGFLGYHKDDYVTGAPLL